MKFIPRETNWCRSTGVDKFWLNRDLHLFSFSRDAIEAIIREESGRREKLTLMLPDFLCHTVLDAVTPFAPHLKFYRISENFKIDEADLGSKLSHGELVFFIDYFGRECSISDELRSFLKNHSAVIIKDAAHSFLSLVANKFKTVQLFDYAVTSVHKSLRCHVGSICMGKLAQHQDIVDLQSLFYGTLRLMAKRILCSANQTNFINNGIEKLLISASSQKSSKIMHVNFSRLFRRLLAKIDWHKIITRQRLLSIDFSRHFNNRNNVWSPFSENDCINSALTVFPVVFSSQKDRDEMFFKLRGHGVDCFTWPVFHQMIQRVDLWENLLLLPVEKEVLALLKELQGV